MTEIHLDIAFSDLPNARAFGKWLMNVPMGPDLGQDPAFFVVEPFSVSAEWDFFFGEAWQPKEITLPADEFVILVSGFFACDAEGPGLHKAMQDAVGRHLDVQPSKIAEVEQATNNWRSWLDNYVRNLVMTLKQDSPDLESVQARIYKTDGWQKIYLNVHSFEDYEVKW